MNKCILETCKVKLITDNYSSIINYLFSMDLEEKEILDIFEYLGVDKDIIKDLFCYSFGLDYETIMLL